MKKIIVCLLLIILISSCSATYQIIDRSKLGNTYYYETVNLRIYQIDYFTSKEVFEVGTFIKKDKGKIVPTKVKRNSLIISNERL
jgi:hypothetical protein